MRISGTRLHVLLLTLMWFGSANLAAATADTAAEPEGNDAIVAQLNTAISDIEPLRPLVLELEETFSSLPPEEELARMVTDARLNRAWTSLVAAVNQAAGLVLELEAAGVDVGAQRALVEEMLVAVPEASFIGIDRVSTQISLPTDDKPALEQAAAFSHVSLAAGRVDALFDQVLENLQLQADLGLDTTALQAQLKSRLEERAAQTSAFLDVSSSNVVALDTQSTVMPGDTEIAARLAVARQRVTLAADVLRSIVAQMETQELDTRAYEAQLIAATGEITTDVLDFSVLGNLAASAWESVADWLGENGPGLFFSLLIFLVIVYATFKIASIAQRLVTLALERGQVRLSQLLKRMIVSATRGVIIAVGLLMGLSQLGISLGPLLAGLGIAGFVIGFALQDTLSNFASGMMILFYKPFDVGDVVEAGGVFGNVSHMSLVNTTILTLDNQTLVVPNNKIWGDVIKNLNSQNRRRVDLVFGIGYADDVALAEKVLSEIVAGHESVLKDPEPVVRLHELGDSSVNFIVRPWVNTDDYWPVYWDITRDVKIRFDAEGISIPFPQRDVHLYTENAQQETGLPVSSQETVSVHRHEYDSTSAAVDEDS